jgi:clan AA aspartic protease (TIGR02281 family)
VNGDRGHGFGDRSMRRYFQCVVLGGALLAAPISIARGDEASAKASLAAKGIRATHSGLSLTDEAELAKGFREIATLKRKLQSAIREFNDAQRGVDELNENLHERMQANVSINSQLATSGQSNFVQRNQLVSAANANASAINLLMHEQEQSKKEVDRVRGEVNSARENYIQEILKLRAAADRVAAKYAEIEKDEAAQSAVREWNEAAKTSFELKPSRTFQAALKRIADLEKTFKSEKIPLRREGNSYYATVVVNGDHAVDMIVDTGASSLVLPYKTAMECGVKVDESALPVQMIVASGAKFKSKLVTLDSVRVGQFTAQKVECVVLPPEATNAPILLGMTFLGRYNFSINGTELVISKVDVERSTTLRSKKNRSSKKTVKKPTQQSEPDSSE